MFYFVTSAVKAYYYLLSYMISGRCCTANYTPLVSGESTHYHIMSVNEAVKHPDSGISGSVVEIVIADAKSQFDDVIRI